MVVPAVLVVPVDGVVRAVVDPSTAVVDAPAQMVAKGQMVPLVRVERWANLDQ